MCVIEWVRVWEFQQLRPLTSPIVSQLTRGVMGADVGRWGGSRGTIRLESAAAAWTNRQTDWGSEGLKPVKAWGWGVGRGSALGACYKSSKCSLDWNWKRGTEGVDRRRRVHLCFSHPHPPPHPSGLFVVSKVCWWNPWDLTYCGPLGCRHTNANCGTLLNCCSTPVTATHRATPGDINNPVGDLIQCFVFCIKRWRKRSLLVWPLPPLAWSNMICASMQRSRMLLILNGVTSRAHGLDQQNMVLLLCEFLKCNLVL